MNDNENLTGAPTPPDPPNGEPTEELSVDETSGPTQPEATRVFNAENTEVPTSPTRTWPTPLSPDRPLLSNAISLGSVGIMALIAAIGILFAFNSQGATNSATGTIVLVSVGLIVALAGGILVYTALKGLRAGWFLPFTIVGAIIGFPIVLAGAAMTSYEGYYETGSYGYAVEETGEDDSWSGDSPWADAETVTSSVYEGSQGETVEIVSEGNDVRIEANDLAVLDPSQTDVSGTGSPLLLNLTGVEDGVDQRFNVELSESGSSLLVVALTQEQLPMVNYWEMEDQSWVTTDYVPFTYENDWPWSLSEWVDSGFYPYSYPGGLGDPQGGDPDNTFYFNLQLEGESTLVFLVVGDEVSLSDSLTPTTSPQPQSQSGSQSGGQSGGNN